MSKVDELKVKMSVAVKAFNESGDMLQIQAVSKEMDKAKTEIAKQETDKLLKESEALAGKREALGKSIYTEVCKLGWDKPLAEVKAKGFTYTIDHKENDKGAIDPNGTVSVKGGVGLLVSAVKVHKAGTTGGNGKSKDEYGVSLAEIVEKFATPEEQAAIEAEGISNSKSWQLKVAVKKRAIADGKLSPAK